MDTPRDDPVRPKVSVRHRQKAVQRAHGFSVVNDLDVVDELREQPSGEMRE